MQQLSALSLASSLDQGLLSKCRLAPLYCYEGIVASSPEILATVNLFEDDLPKIEKTSLFGSSSNFGNVVILFAIFFQV